MAIIVISHEIGAGGPEIGQALGGAARVPVRRAKI